MSKSFALSSLVLLIVLALWAWKDYNREWKTYQRTFYALENKGSTDESEKKGKNRYEIKQIDLPELNRTDRCITCHLGVEDPGMIKVKPPHKVHPDFSQHPFLGRSPQNPIIGKIDHAEKVHSCSHCKSSSWRGEILGGAYASFKIYSSLLC